MRGRALRREPAWSLPGTGHVVGKVELGRPRGGATAGGRGGRGGGGGGAPRAWRGRGRAVRGEAAGSGPGSGDGVGKGGRGRPRGEATAGARGGVEVRPRYWHGAVLMSMCRRRPLEKWK